MIQSTRSRRRLSFWSIVTLAALAIFIFLLILPLGKLLFTSIFSDGEMAIDTYVRFFTKSYYYETLLNSFLVSILATLFATLIGAPLAYLITRYNIPGKLILRAGIVLTFVSPPFIGAYAWVLILGRNGVVTQWFDKIGFSLPSIYGMRGILLVFTLQALPFIFLMVSSALRSVDQSVEDAAINLGRKPLSVVLGIIAPIIIPAASTGGLLVFVTSFSDFGTPMILGEKFRVLAPLIYTEFNNEHGGNPVVASSLALIMLVVTVGALLLHSWYMRRKSHGSEVLRPLEPRTLKGWRHSLAVAYVYIVVGLAALPLITIVISSFLKTKGPKLTAEFTLSGYAESTRLGLSLKNSLFFSVTATILCVIAGSLIGYVVTRRRDPLAQTVDLFSMVPYAVAGVVLGIAVSVTFGGSPFFLGGTGAILILVYFIRRLPYSIRTVAGTLSQIGTQTEEASVNLGVGPAKTFWKITVPQIAPGILSGTLLTFATVIREFNSTVILYSGKTRTIPVEVFSHVLQGNFAKASVVGTVLILMSAIPIVVLFKFMGKDEDVLI